MSEADEIDAWDERLAAAERDLAEREALAHTTKPSAKELAALAAESDKLAADRDRLANAHDAAANQRDLDALARDLLAARLDIRARDAAGDPDPGFRDRHRSAVDRDSAAGDRLASIEDRNRARENRQRAAADRKRASKDRDDAASQLVHSDRVLSALHDALDDRSVIGHAQGILIERHHVDSNAAFEILARLARSTDRSMRDVAQDVVALTIAGWSETQAAVEP